MFPDPSSPGAQTAQAIMRNYRPTFDAKLVSLKGDMATKNCRDDARHRRW